MEKAMIRSVSYYDEPGSSCYIVRYSSSKKRTYYPGIDSIPSWIPVFIKTAYCSETEKHPYTGGIQKTYINGKVP